MSASASPKATAPMISIDAISKWYGPVQVLKDCTTQVTKGEVVVVCGPSGSGKSTLIKTVNALEPIQKGSITVDGIGVQAKGTDLPKLRSRVGMVFQHFELFPHLSITDNLTLGQRKVLGRSAEAARTTGLKLLDRVGLGAHAHKYPGQLSGGQQQRVAIARALSMNPIVMLFDEPTSALDPISTGRIEELIEQLRSEFTIVIVTHNMQQAARISQYTAFMYLGEVIEFAPTNTIFMNPAKKQTQDYVTGRFG